MENFLSGEIMISKNKMGDEIELAIYRYENRYKVFATLCDDHPPFRDITTMSEINYSRLRSKHGSQKSRMEAINMALKELYTQTYK
jgi:hypothetical protein